MQNKNSKNHSFYKEQQKSILGQQQWSAKRIGKLLFTIFKWFLWGFLIVATLWGCVNEFIIQTSNNLGQGVEFYQKDDFVYPNTYQAVNIVGYTATDKAVSEGIGTKDVAKEESHSLPFNFYVVNPHYGDDEWFADNSDVDYEPYDYYITAAQAGNSYAYNLNQVSALDTGILTYDFAALNAFSGGDGIYVPVYTIPSSITNTINEEIDNESLDKDHTYKVSKINDLSYYLLDKSDSKLDGKAKSTDLINWKTDDVSGEWRYSDMISSNVTPMLKKGFTSADDVTEVANWDTSLIKLGVQSSTTEDETIRLEDQYKLAANKLAFNSGTGVYSDTDTIIVDGEEKTLAEQFNNSGYEVNYASLLKPTDAKAVYGGAQTMIVPIKKGFPVRIDEQGQQIIKEEFRDYDLESWDTSKSQHQDSGFDVYNQMYGWTILDATYGQGISGFANNEGKAVDYQASLLRVYDDATSAATNNVYDGLDEEHSFYADQRRLGWGMVSETDKSNNIDGVEYSVFDEKVKQWMSDDVFMHMNGSYSIGHGDDAKIVSYSYGSKFAGMTSTDRLGVDDDSYTGVLPKVEGNFERSIFSDAIIPTRQDSWGESRVTFIGWSDWGKAWDVQYGPLYGAFVFPLAQLAMGTGEIFHYMASAWGTIFSIIVIVFLTRGLGALLSLKGTSNQMKMQEVQTDVAKIKAKYSKYDLKADPRMKQKQQMEIMALYRKKEINPMGSLGTIFITMPIFISLWIIISSLPAYKVVFMGGFSWAVSSWFGIFNTGWLFFLYLLVGISVGLVQGVSSKVPTWLSNKRKGIKRIDDATKEAQKKQNKTQNIMIGVFVFMGLTVPALFAFYWICSGFFTIILELIKHAWKVHVAEQMKKDPSYATPMSKMIAKIKK